jgi:hypothetical protein
MGSKAGHLEGSCAMFWAPPLTDKQKSFAFRRNSLELILCEDFFYSL